MSNFLKNQLLTMLKVKIFFWHYYLLTACPKGWQCNVSTYVLQNYLAFIFSTSTVRISWIFFLFFNLWKWKKWKINKNIGQEDAKTVKVLLLLLQSFIPRVEKEGSKNVSKYAWLYYLTLLSDLTLINWRDGMLLKFWTNFGRANCCWKCKKVPKSHLLNLLKIQQIAIWK